LHAAIAVARGGFTLGDIFCIEGDVLYCALEDNPRRLKRRGKKLLGSDPWPRRLRFECSMPRLNSGGVAFIRKWIESKAEARLVVIDTLAKVRDPKGAQESSYEADYSAVSELKALADEKGVAIVLVHHQRKMLAGDPLDTVSGTIGLTGAVDTVLVMVRDGNGTTLYGTGRDLEQIEDAAEFDRDSCVWTIKGKAEDVRRSDERRTILNVLGEAAGPLTTREITDLAGMSYEAGRKRLARLVTDNEIDRVGRGLFKLSQKPCPKCPNVPMQRAKTMTDSDMSQSMSQPKPSLLEGLGHWDTWDSGFRDADAAPPYSGDTVTNGNPWRGGNPADTSKGQADEN
jgi:hypothetical protein